MDTSATTPLRRTIYGLVLVLFAFIQRPGLIVADTKFDLVVDPGRFLSRATSMWDGGAAFGQIQNQAYGYFFPMGPFFWIGEQLGLEPWVTQRLWWSLLLILAFFGLLKVAETLGVGKSWTRVVAAFAYALSVHITTIIGGASIEAWPTALAPWVLWAVMRGTDAGSERRWAALAGLLTAACGGVNAVAVAVVLPLGACWIFTRAGGRRRWVFFAWWVGCTLLATLWWLVPLFLMGSYSFPFLDYIENATVTTLPTDLPDVINGSSVWVPYVSAGDQVAGRSLGMTPFLIVDAALLAGLGLAGLARRDTPHRQFLLVSLMVGLVLLSFGYTGGGSGWFAGDRQDLLDGALAPLRNLHKFDAVIRLPLVLGLAHVLAAMMPSWSRATWSVRLWPGVAVLALVGTASPWFIPSVAPAGAMQAVPDYWVKAANYLNNHDDSAGGHGRTLVVPASAFGTYDWGSPRDDVLQPLMTAAWGVRNVIPLAEPGNVAFLDAVTAEIEAGRPSKRLAGILAANGVSRLVVRNDLDRTQSGAPDPVILHQALDRSPGLRAVADFGPFLGWKPSVDVDDDRVLPSGGLSDSYAAVEVYDVVDTVGAVSTTDAADLPVVAGGAGAGLVSSLVPGEFLLAGDNAAETQDFILTDTLRRREKAFSAVRHNESSTLSPGDSWRLSGREHFHRMFPDEERWMATTSWDGVRGVTASSSQAWGDAVPPVDRGNDPGAVLDGDPASVWRTARGQSSVGQWWQVDFLSATDLDDIAFRVPEDTFVTRVRVSNGDEHVDVDIGDAGEAQHVATGFGSSSSLRISVLEVANGAEMRGFALAEVDVPGVSAQRYLDLPAPPDDAHVTGVSLNRDFGTSACFDTSESQVCQDFWATRGEDGDVIARHFTLPAGGDHELHLQGSLRSGEAAVEEIVSTLPFEASVSSSSTTDLRGSVLAAVDGNEDSTWVADLDDEDPTLRIEWPERQRVSRVELATDDSAPGARPTEVSVSAGGRVREVELDERGRGRFPAVLTRRVEIRVLEAAPVYADTVAPGARMPAAVSELAISGSAHGPNLVDPGDRGVRLRCGEGPSLEINGETIDTSVEATLAELLRGRMSVRACAPDVALDAGENAVLARPSAAVRLDHVDLSDPGTTVPVGTENVDSVPVTAWSDDHRTVRVAPRQGRRLLVVAENFNAGWEARLDGEVLDPQRVGGWKQGWWVPEGSSGEVQLTFVPQKWFIGGLLAGILGLLLVLGLALLPGRGDGRTSASRESRRPLAWLVLLPVAGLVSGWAGFGLAAVAMVVAGVARRRLRDAAWTLTAPGLTAATLLVVAGGWTAWDRHQTESLTDSWVGQLLVLSALVAAVVGAGPKGPESLKRNKGRSTA